MDTCADNLEDGDGGCTTLEESPYDAGTYPDPNNDNYNIDPSNDKWVDAGEDGILSKDEDGYDEINNPDPEGDDYHVDDNSGGKEGNGKIDDNELYENFLDFGIDQLPDVYENFDSDYVVVDDNYDVNDNPSGTEGDEYYNLGEYFYDYGTDKQINVDEDGYNPSGSEGNENFDYNSEGTELYEDYGEDQCPDNLEDGSDGCTTLELSPYDEESNPDPNGDYFIYDFHTLKK